MSNHSEAERRAAGFLARRDGGAWSAADEAELTSWLSESTVHRVAYLRLEATWEEARRLRALAAGLPSGQVPEAGEWRRTPFFARFPLRGQSTQAPSRGAAPPQPSRGHLRRRLSVAAGLIAVLVGSAAYYLSRESGEDYRTEVGGVTSVPLGDGSTVTLNTASEVHVDLKPNEREVHLDRGEAFFVVAKDPHRPFVVEAGDKRVIAVGTAFSVRRLGSDIRVAVTEGRVRVESMAMAGGGAFPPQKQNPLTEEVGSGAALVAPGDVASVGDAGVVIEQQSPAQVEESLSWRQGYLTFHDESLAGAVAEFNRYNTHRIVISDPAIASIRISGTFRAVNREAFVRLLDEGFGIHASIDGDVTTLSRE